MAVAPDGTIYAAGVGSKQAPSLVAPPVQVAPAPITAAGAPAGARPAASPAPPSTVGAPGRSVSGGSELYRIAADGYPSKIWSHAQEIVYAIAFDSTGRVLLGTGNKGEIYRIESDLLYTALLNAPPTQVTAFAPGRDGALYVATGNVGKVYQIGPELEDQGSIESDVFDADMFSYWGRLSFEGRGRIAVSTRSGNLDRPHQNWSPWSAPITSTDGGRVVSPAARFLQWKATLTRQGTELPELRSVEVAYLEKNVPPQISEIEITPPNYRFPVSILSVSASRSLSLPPLGRRAASPMPALTLETTTSTPTMEYAKGSIGARWIASDENGDTLLYTVYIRGEKETEWKLLRDKVREKYLSWDSTAFPDGEYRLKVAASDAPSNPRERALTNALEGERFIIDNTPPAIANVAAVRKGSQLEVRWHAADAVSVIESAEYSLDGGDWTAVSPTTMLSDSPRLDYALTLDKLTPGEHTIAVRVEDSYGNQATAKTVVR